MINSENNFKRALAEVVSVDGWSKPDPDNPGQADIHTHVTFRSATMGRGDERAKVTFDLAIEQAEVLVVIEETSALNVVGGSVDQTAPIEYNVSSKETRSRKSGISGEIGGEGPKGMFAKFSAFFSRSKENTQTRSGDHVERSINANYFKLDGHHGWIITPQQGSELHGAVWDAAAERRLRVIDKRPKDVRESEIDKGFAPELRLMVRCLPEHLLITNICPTDKFKGEIPKNAMDLIQMTAAEQYLKERLLEENLIIADPGRDLDRYVVGQQVISVG